MKGLNRLRPRPAHLIIYEGHSFVIADLKGFIGTGLEGFYYRQTRFLSRLRFAVDGQEPNNVSANAVDAYSWVAYYLAPSPAGAKAGPKPDGGEGGGEMVRHGIEVQVNGYVSGGLHLDIHITNHTLAQANLEVSWIFEADFADRAEAEQGKRQQNAPVERDWEPGEAGGKLSFHYRHPQLPHGTEVCFSGPDPLQWVIDIRAQRQRRGANPNARNVHGREQGKCADIPRPLLLISRFSASGRPLSDLCRSWFP